MTSHCSHLIEVSATHHKEKQEECSLTTLSKADVRGLHGTFVVQCHRRCGDHCFQRRRNCLVLAWIVSRRTTTVRWKLQCARPLIHSQPILTRERETSEDVRVVHMLCKTSNKELILMTTVLTMSMTMWTLKMLKSTTLRRMTKTTILSVHRLWRKRHRRMTGGGNPNWQYRWCACTRPHLTADHKPLRRCRFWDLIE